MSGRTSFTTHEGSQCPIHFSDNELQNYEQELRRYTKYQESITSLDDDLGCGGDGWVPEDEFSRVMKGRKANWDDEVNGGPFPYENGLFSFLS